MKLHRFALFFAYFCTSCSVPNATGANDAGDAGGGDADAGDADAGDAGGGDADAGDADAGEVCSSDQQCPADNECGDWSCGKENRCQLLAVAANTPVSDQVDGDCHENVCDGSGSVVSIVVDTDFADDDNPCTLDQCTAGAVEHPIQTGEYCGVSGMCDGLGVCNEPTPGCAGLGGLQRGAAWPTAGYCSSHLGRSPFNGPTSLDIAAKGPDTGVWSWAAAVAADGTIYVGGGGDSGNLRAYTPTGELLWQFPAIEPMCPTIGEDGVIYSPSRSGNLYAINPDGSLRWQYFTAPGKPTCPALAENGTIYIAANTEVYAINPNGSYKWTTWLSGSTPVNVPVAVSPQGAILAFSEDTVHRYGPDGALHWTYTLDGIIDGFPAVAPDETLYAGGAECLYAISPNGTLQWKWCGEGKLSHVAVAADGTVYVGSFDRNVYAIKGGVEVWRFLTEATARGPIVVDRAGLLYVPVYDQKAITYALNADGTELSRADGVLSLGALTATGHLVARLGGMMTLLGPPL